MGFITNGISPLAGLTVNFDWVNLYQHNSHYDPAKCQWCRPCCDRLFRGLLKLWHFLTNDCIIWVEGEACCWITNCFIKRRWFIHRKLKEGVPAWFENATLSAFREERERCDTMLRLFTLKGRFPMIHRYCWCDKIVVGIFFFPHHSMDTRLA